MATPEQLCYLSASEMARLLRRGDLSARDLVSAHLQQIERLNPKVNAIVTLLADRAMKQAATADDEAAHGRFAGPLHGIPVAHKDLEETAGIRTTFGSPIFRDYVPDFSSLIVERMSAAGAIALGKTNTPEFGAGSQTYNPVFGATRNPWDLSKTCGGSSGGAAVALACGMTALADGSDLGGSLRNPASFCSVVGFRTSPGRVPRVPTTSAWNPLPVPGPMARTVEDVAMMLSAIAGPDLRAPLSIQQPGTVFAQPLGHDWTGTRAAWCAGLKGVPFDKRVMEVFGKTRKFFEEIGCTLEEAEPDFTGADEVFRVFRALTFYGGIGALLGSHRSQMKQSVIGEIERGAKLTGPDIAAAEAKRSQLLARVGEFLTKYEFFILPTVQVPPFDVGQEYVTEIEGIPMDTYIDWMKSCYYVSVTGLPAISVPAGFTPEQLPVGIQIVGRPQRDFEVLQLAWAFEQARGILPTPPLR